MTCYLSPTDWRDVLYNAVRQAPGGVVAAAAFLTQRRGRSMHSETLRARLRGIEGEWVNLEILELLTEWMQDSKHAEALAWLGTLNNRFGMVALALPPPPTGGWACEAAALREKALQLGVEGGHLTQLVMRATDDKRISVAEAEEITAQAMAEVELLYRNVRNARRAAGLEVQE